MAKKEPAIKNRKVKACNVANLIDPKRDLNLSLNKCSEKTKFRSSLFDMLVG